MWPNPQETVDMTAQQSEVMNTANKRVATSPQWQQCDLMGAAKKCDCLLFDIFRNRISQLEKEILKKARKLVS